MGLYFGRPVEEEMERLMRNNKRITKLGFSCNDAHWRDQIDRFMIRNNDIARRLRKRGSRTNLEDEVVAVEKQLARLTLVNPPADKKAWEVFEDDDDKMNIARTSTADSKRLP